MSSLWNRRGSNLRRVKNYQNRDIKQEADSYFEKSHRLPGLPGLSPALGSSPHMDTGGREERGREDGEGGETGREEEGEEREEGEEGEVSMGAGPLE